MTNLSKFGKICNEIEELGGYTQGKGEAYEIEQTDNTLLCNGNFVFSDPDITKLYIVLGKHLLTVWQNEDFLTK